MLWEGGTYMIILMIKMTMIILLVMMMMMVVRVREDKISIFWEN